MEESTVEFTVSKGFADTYKDIVKKYSDLKDRPIVEYDYKGNKLAIWNNILHIEAATGIKRKTILDCCRGKSFRVTNHRRIFLFKGDSIKDRLKAIEDAVSCNSSVHIPIREYTLNGKFVRYWKSVASISKSLNLRYSTIKTHLLHNKSDLNGRIFLQGNTDVNEVVARIKKQKKIEAEIESLRRALDAELAIKVYNSDGEYLATCNNVKDAIKRFHLKSGNTIHNQINGRSLVSEGLIFLSYGESIEERMEKIRNRKTWKHYL